MTMDVINEINGDTMSNQLPTWDLSQYFPSLESEEFIAESKYLKEMIAQQVSTIDSAIADPNTDPVKFAETYLETSRELMQRLSTMGSYVYGHISVNTRDAIALKAMSEMQIALIPLRQAQSRLTAWLGDQDIDAIVDGSDTARE